MKERLTALAEALQRISDNYGIASQWQPDYAAARVQLDGIIADADKIMAPPPAVEQRVLTSAELDGLVDKIADRVGVAATEVQKVIAEIHDSDVTVLAAIADTRAELLAAAAPAA